MPDSFTEVTSQSWFSRLGDSIKSVLVGLALFGVSFPVLWWNEGRAVRTAQSLEEGAGAVVSVPADRVDTGNEGKLVHLSGEATTTETLADPEFGVQANALKLHRNAEMYQWREEKKSETRNKIGGGTETVTTYTYTKGWSDDLIDSGRFKEPVGHGNPGALPVSSRTLTAARISVGAFTLAPDQVARLDRTEPLRLDAQAAAALPAGVKEKAKIHDGTLYLGADPAAPAVGDARVSFKVVRPGPVSLVAGQVGSTFEAYRAKAGDSILLVKEGTVSAQSMFQAAQEANTALTWILRGMGFFLMFFGLLMVFRPIAVFGDVVPIVGTLLGAGLGVFSLFVSVALSLVTIAVSWLAARPLLGGLLLVVAVGATVGLVVLASRRRQAKAAGASPA